MGWSCSAPSLQVGLLYHQALGVRFTGKRSLFPPLIYLKGCGFQGLLTVSSLIL